MHVAYLLTGGNIGDRLYYLKEATRAIMKCCGRLVKESFVYETAAWGKTDQPSFYNQCLLLHTLLQPQQLMQQLLVVEQSLGRERTEKNGARTIDIDILLFDDCIINTPSLTIPHPRLTQRRFALTPLAEIAPDIMHPAEHKTISQLLQSCTDPLHVNKIQPTY